VAPQVARLPPTRSNCASLVRAPGVGRLPPREPRAVRSCALLEVPFGEQDRHVVIIGPGRRPERVRDKASPASRRVVPHEPPPPLLAGMVLVHQHGGESEAGRVQRAADVLRAGPVSHDQMLGAVLGEKSSRLPSHLSGGDDPLVEHPAVFPHHRDPALIPARVYRQHRARSPHERSAVASRGSRRATPRPGSAAASAGSRRATALCPRPPHRAAWT